jgi:hypothetical protein
VKLNDKQFYNRRATCVHVVLLKLVKYGLFSGAYPYSSFIILKTKYYFSLNRFNLLAYCMQQ